MTELRLGLRENLPQFSLLVLLNAFVGAMVGLERTVLPLLGEQEFGLGSKTAITSFIVSFGVTKAVLNLVAARLSDRIGRKPILVVGWLFALPVPFLIIHAPAWWWIDLANVLLGANQALAWSMTVIMKIDLVGPRRRGLALGLNELAGYFAVGTMSWLTGYIAGHYALRPQPFYLGIAISVVGLLMALFLIRETRGYLALETAPGPATGRPPSLARIFYGTGVGNVSLFAACQAGLVNNLNDGMSWGLYPLFFSAHGLDVERIGVIKAAYPIVWGLTAPDRDPDAVGPRGAEGAHRLGHGRPGGGHLAHRAGAGVRRLAVRRCPAGAGDSDGLAHALGGHRQHAHPTWRASSLGVYRFWRDLGYAIGALVSGLVADFVGLRAAIHLVAALTLVSGVVVAWAMHRPRPAPIAAVA